MKKSICEVYSWSFIFSSSMSLKTHPSIRFDQGVPFHFWFHCFSFWIQIVVEAIKISHLTLVLAAAIFIVSSSLWDTECSAVLDASTGGLFVWHCIWLLLLFLWAIIVLEYCMLCVLWIFVDFLEKGMGNWVCNPFDDWVFLRFVFEFLKLIYFASQKKHCITIGWYQEIFDGINNIE